MSICPSCGANTPDESNFCLKCGTSLTGATGQLSPDTIMEGRYIIVKVIGRGGMGAVYLALDQRLNNMPVAIKEMSTGATGVGNLQRAVESFKLEAAMLINLEHQALPRIRDFFQKEDRWYLVMDYIEGETLKEIVEKRGPVSDNQILDWAKQLCDILDYLHSQQPPVIFRDLKPSNIMLTNKGVIKLIDFGIARHFKPGQNADTIAFGSTGFAPPEQYGNSQTDARTDIFALGATLHYLATGIDPGSRPFNFEPPSKRVNISPSLEYAIMKAVEMQVEKRFESTKEMMDALIAGKEEAVIRFNLISADHEVVNKEEVESSKAVEHFTKEGKKEEIKESKNISPEVKHVGTVGLLDFSEEEDLNEVESDNEISEILKVEEDKSRQVLENRGESEETRGKNNETISIYSDTQNKTVQNKKTELIDESGYMGEINSNERYLSLNSNYIKKNSNIVNEEIKQDTKASIKKSQSKKLLNILLAIYVIAFIAFRELIYQILYQSRIIGFDRDVLEWNPIIYNNFTMFLFTIFIISFLILIVFKIYNNKSLIEKLIYLQKYLGALVLSSLIHVTFIEQINIYPLYSFILSLLDLIILILLSKKFKGAIDNGKQKRTLNVINIINLLIVIVNSSIFILLMKTEDVFIKADFYLYIFLLLCFILKLINGLLVRYKLVNDYNE